jgi:hypothetical protein
MVPQEGFEPPTPSLRMFVSRWHLRACCCIGEPKADWSATLALLLIHLPSIALLALAALACGRAQAEDDAHHGKGTICYRDCYPTGCD